MKVKFKVFHRATIKDDKGYLIYLDSCCGHVIVTDVAKSDDLLLKKFSFGSTHIIDVLPFVDSEGNPALMYIHTDHSDGLIYLFDF